MLAEASQLDVQRLQRSPRIRRDGSRRCLSNNITVHLWYQNDRNERLVCLYTASVKPKSMPYRETIPMGADRDTWGGLTCITDAYNALSESGRQLRRGKGMFQFRISGFDQRHDCALRHRVTVRCELLPVVWFALAACGSLRRSIAEPASVEFHVCLPSCVKFLRRSVSREKALAVLSGRLRGLYQRVAVHVVAAASDLQEPCGVEPRILLSKAVS